jgi:hypothetical protein
MRVLARAFLGFVVVGATFFHPPSASAADSITQAAPISGDQTLVSAGGIFQLGFVPDDGKAYLGIWYANISGPRTVVWVANRHMPFVQSPGVLQLTADGRLAVLDRQNATVWSSPTRNVTAGGGSAQLCDNGNFVLKSTDGSVAWQSFDYPSDTLLPGMKLGVTGRAGIITSNITSWKAPSDPSPGDYTFKLVLGGMPEFFLIQDRTTKTYGSGPFNGEVLTGVPYLQSNDDFNFTVVSTPEETYYSYTIDNASRLSRLVVNGTGKLQRYVWENGTWRSYWDFPNDRCDKYSECGAFGYCHTGSPWVCSCLPGFTPRWLNQWSLHDFKGGCVRTANLSCGGGSDGFWAVKRMKLPDATNATVRAGLTLDQCKQACLSDCSCRAYAAANVSGGVSRGCVTWDVDLLDMRQFPTTVTALQDVYIRLAQSQIHALNAAGSHDFHSNFF